MKKIFKVVVLCICISPLFAEWVMFADKGDTYLYNNQTGEIYIRYKEGGKNYNDVFVKMSHGLQPQDLQDSIPQNLGKRTQDIRLESLKKSKEMLDEAIDGAF